MRQLRRFFALVPVAVLGACSASGGSVEPATTRTSAPTTTISPTVAPTSTSPTTTMPSTTSPASTTPPIVAAGWRQIDPLSITGHASFPCCADTWHGEPSPQLPAPGAPLPDGSFAAVVTWPADLTAPLQLELRRFDPCALLPEFSCEQPVGTWPPDALGIDESASYSLYLPLDEHVRVVVAGLAGRDPAIGELVTMIAEGNGADLAALAAAVETAHATVLGARLAAGMTPAEIINEVNAHPEGGFIPGLDGQPTSLSFVYDGAPTLLFQVPFGFEDPAAARGTDVLRVPSVEMVDGVLTVYVFAGYSP